MKLSLNLPAALVAALKTRAAADRRSLSNLVALLLERQLLAQSLVTGSTAIRSEWAAEEKS